MKQRCVYSSNEPQHIDAIQLYDGVFDVSIAEDIKQTTQTRRRPDKEPETVDVYEYNRLNAIVRADDYGSFIAGTIHIKYTADDELALVNKGIVDKTNSEYVAYREFVDEVKQIAREYFDKE